MTSDRWPFDSFEFVKDLCVEICCFCGILSHDDDDDDDEDDDEQLDEI